MMKQILLITDGCSNIGIQPAIAAAEAKRAGITINVVGIVDYGTIGQLGACEIAEVAKAGGGISKIIPLYELGETIQLVTYATQTIPQAIASDRQAILSVKETEDVSTPLKIALLIDTSASMKPKLATVEEAIRAFIISLHMRNQENELTVFHFPGRCEEQVAVQDIAWTNNIKRVKRLFQRLNMRGTTPTGPALLQVIAHF